jgi:hypothetical protein
MSYQNKYLSIVLAVLCFCPWTTSFADNTGGSSYSRYGVGDIRYFSTSRAMGMGGAGIAVLSNQVIDRFNPALWTRVNRVRFSAGAMYEGFSSTDLNGSSYLSKTHVNSLSLAVPIERDFGISLSAGVAPYSKVNYNILSPSTQGSLNYTLKYLGEGGLSLAHLGISGSIGHELHLGTKLDYYFGSINHTISQTFTTTDYSSAEVMRSTRLSGAGITFGVVYSGLKNLLNLSEGTAFNIAAVVNTTSYITTTDERFSTFNSGTVVARDTVAFPDGKLRLPYSFIVGLAYQSENITIAGDVAYQKWSDLSSNGVTFSDIRDSYRFGLGMELLPKKDMSAPFTQRIAYRAGFFYQASYYQINNTPINEFGITGGMGIPLFADTRLGIAAEYSFRGTTDFQLQKDKILRISFTLDIGELWFIRPPEE